MREEGGGRGVMRVRLGVNLLQHSHIDTTLLELLHLLQFIIASNVWTFFSLSAYKLPPALNRYFK